MLRYLSAALTALCAGLLVSAALAGRDGTGAYTAPTNSFNPAVSGQPVDPAAWNAILTDLESALTASVYTDDTSSTDDCIVRADGTNGKKVQGSGVCVDDSNNVTGVAGISLSAVQTTTAAANTVQFNAYDVDGASYTTFGTLTAGNDPSFELDDTTLDTAIAKGTWTASGTWTIPAVTFGGTVTWNGQSASGTLADLGTVTTADINGGTIDGAMIGASAPAAATVTSLTATTANIDGGTIDGTAIGGTTAAAVDATTLTAEASVVLEQTTANYTLTWADPGAARAISIPDPGGTDVFTFNDASQTLTNKSLTSPAATGTLDIQQALSLTGDTSPAQITANQNNYAPANFATNSVIRLDADAARDITGLAAGSDGLEKVLCNVGASTITLTDEDTNSTAANRFAVGVDLELTTKQCTRLVYDATSSRWRSQAVTAAAASGAPTSAQYVTLATDGGLSAERVLTAGNGISITDAGAGSTVTVAVNASYVALESGSLPSASVKSWDISALGWTAYNAIEICFFGASATANEDMSLEVSNDGASTFETTSGDYAGVYCEGSNCNTSLLTAGAAFMTVTGGQTTNGCLRMTGLKAGRLVFTGEGVTDTAGFLQRSFYTVGLGSTITDFRMRNVTGANNWDAGTYEVNGYYN